MGNSSDSVGPSNIFWGKKIPELARGLVKGIREFKDATKEIKNEIEEGVKDDPPVSGEK